MRPLLIAFAFVFIAAMPALTADAAPGLTVAKSVTLSFSDGRFWELSIPVDTHLRILSFTSTASAGLMLVRDGETLPVWEVQQFTDARCACTVRSPTLHAPFAANIPAGDYVLHSHANGAVTTATIEFDGFSGDLALPAGTSSATLAFSLTPQSVETTSSATPRNLNGPARVLVYAFGNLDRVAPHVLAVRVIASDGASASITRQYSPLAQGDVWFQQVLQAPAGALTFTAARHGDLGAYAVIVPCVQSC